MIGLGLGGISVLIQLYNIMSSDYSFTYYVGNHEV